MQELIKSESKIDLEIIKLVVSDRTSLLPGQIPNRLLEVFHQSV